MATLRLHSAVEVTEMKAMLSSGKEATPGALLGVCYDFAPVYHMTSIIEDLVL